MGKVYHILLIDDEESNIDLIETELSKLDIQVRIDVIQEEEQLIDRLEHHSPDLVISDYHMPALTGTHALQIVQDRHPQLPFILVAGSIGEEKAINIMLQGASDYAMKQNLDRLGPAVLRELANYEDHKKQISRYKNLMGSVNGVVWEADAKTLEFLYVSRHSEQLLGHTPEEWLGEPNFWEDHIHPDDRGETIHLCQHKTQQGDDHSFEYRMLDADGEVVWVRDYVTVVMKNGEPNRLHGLLVDISKEKKAERQRDKAYEIANIGHWELDVKNEELYWSNTVKQLHEVGPDYEPDLDTALAFYKEGKHRRKIATAVESALTSGASFEEELEIITAGDNEKWVRVVGETEFRNGECIRIYGSTQDISKRKVSEKKYRDIFNLSPQPMWVYDPKTLKFLDVNQAAITHYGFSYEEFMNITLKDIRPEDDIPDLMEAVKEIRSKKDSYYEGLFRHKTKDESIIHVNVKRNTVYYEGRKAAMVLAEDVTEKLQAKRKLQLSEQKFKSLVRSGASMIATLNDEGDYTYASENHKQIAGWSPQELIGKNAFSFIHPDDIKRVKNVFKKLKTEKTKQHTLPFRFKHKKGHWLWKESIGSDLSEDTILDGYVINSHDVTDRRYYTELEKIERDILEDNTIGSLDLPNLVEKLLIKIEDLHPCMTCSILKIVNGKLQNLSSPSLPDAYLEEIEELEIGRNTGSCGTAAYLKEPVIAENIYEDPRWEGYRHLGDKYDFSACWSKPIIDTNQNVLATFAIYYKKPQAPSEREKNTIDRVVHLLRLLFNSFEKEKAEQKLALREQRFKSLVQDGSDLIAILDPEANYTYVSPTSNAILGIPPEEFVGTNALDYIHENDQQRVANALENLEQKEQIELEPFRFRNSDGEWRWIESIITNMLDNPAVKGFVANSRDVTDQIEHQQKLRKSVERFEIVSKATSDTIWDLNLQTDTITYNHNIYNMFGYEKQEVENIGDWWRNKIHPDDRPEVLERIDEALSSSSDRFQIEYRFQAADGSYKYIYDRAFIVEEPKDNPIRIIGAMQDISNQKEAEETLRELYQKNRMVLESTDEGIYGIDTDGRCTFINKAAANMLGYRSEECIGKNMHELIHHQHPNGDPYPESACPIFISKNDRESCRVTDEVFWRANGTCFNVEYTSNPMIKDNQIKGAVVAFSDITERKQRQKELQQSLTEKETLLQEIHHRVKNNLAVVSGMMQMQAFEEDDENIRQKLSDSINRIQTMGGIHELLYQSESFSRIDANKNIRKLVTDIVKTFEIAVDLDIDFNLQKISLNINQAIPLSLIVNEVITNVMKHAFVDRSQGTLSVSLAEEDNVVSIHIMDNGQGLPDDFERTSKHNSLGLQLINTLSTQLDAEYTYESMEEGTLFTFTFEKANIKGIGNARLN